MHMNQRKMGTILSYLYIIITNSISLFYTPYMLRMMGQSEYGLYGTANSFISYLNVLSFGIGGAYIRFNAKCRASKDREEEKRLNGMFLTIFSILAVLVLIGGVCLVAFSGKLVENTFTSQELYRLRIIMVIMTLNMMCTFIFNVVMMALQAYEKFVFIRVVLLLAGIINPIVNIIVLKLGGRAVAISVIAFLISLFTYISFLVYARRSIKLEFGFKGFKWKTMRELFVFSMFLFINSLTDQITFSTDSVILSSLKGTAAVAVYTVGANFKAYFQNFSISISSVFASRVNRIVAQKEGQAPLNELFVRVGRIQFYIVSLILIGYCAIGQDFIRLWAGEEYGDAFWIGLFLMLAVFVPAFQNIGLEIQKALNMHKARSIAYFVIAVANIFLTIPLSMLWEGIGAAFATFISMFIGRVLFMNYYYAVKVHLDMKEFWKSILGILPGCIIPIVVGIIMYLCWHINSFLDVLCTAVVITISYVISVWVFSMNQYEKKLLIAPLRKMFKR